MVVCAALDRVIDQGFPFTSRPSDVLAQIRS
jgi:hypothetical protein